MKRSAVVPVVAAVSVFGVSYGVLATAAGLPPWLTVVMSMAVFAGSSQFAAVAALGAGGPGAAVAAVVSGGLLNLRYLATGAAAARVLPGGRVRRFLLAQLVVDENYALAVGAGTPHHPDADTLIGAGVGLWLGWVLGSAAGGPGRRPRPGRGRRPPALHLARGRPRRGGGRRPPRTHVVIAAVVALAAATVAIKGAGALLPPLPDGLALRLAGLAPALLAALVYTEVAGDRGVPHVDAKLAGVGVATVLAALRAPLAVSVIAGAATAALLRVVT